MKLTHSRAAAAAQGHDHRAPSRHFSKLAGMALLASMAAAPMVFPKHAAAQESKPVAAAVPDSARGADQDSVKSARLRSARSLMARADSAVAAGDYRLMKRLLDRAQDELKPDLQDSAARPAADTAKHAAAKADTVKRAAPALSADEKGDSAVNAFDKTYLSFFRIRWFVGYSANPVIRMSDIPASMRTVNGTVMGNTSVLFPTDYGFITPSFDFGPNLLIRNRVSVTLSGGLELASDVDDMKRNGNIFLDIQSAYPGGLLWYLKPYLCAEAMARVKNAMFVGAGFRVTQESFRVYSGTVDYAQQGTVLPDYWPDHSFNPKSSSPLLDMTVGMPYVFFGICPRYYPGNKDEVNMLFFVGTKEVLSKRTYDLQGGSLGFRKFPFVIGEVVTLDWLRLGWQRSGVKK